METIDYKQKIKDYMNSSEVDTLYKSMLNNLFPELKENEDERIRKALLRFHKSTIDIDGIKGGDILAWLEKQGKHANFRNKIQIGDKVTRNEDGMLVNMSQFKRVAKKDEKQGVQKPADKIEPKFRVGDVIRPKGSTAEYTIESISGECYHGKGWGLHISCDDDYELVEQKPAWSEEDEMIALSIEQVMNCASLLNIVPEKIDKIRTWLKSIRPQSTWKPSDEQMKQLGWVVVQNKDNVVGKELMVLYNDLEKLKS